MPSPRRRAWGGHLFRQASCSDEVDDKMVGS